MEIKQLKLANVGRFEDLTIAFAPTPTTQSNVTIFIGNNGSGKTTILKSLATALSWFVAKVKSERGNGSPLSEIVISNGKNTASIAINCQDTDATSGPYQQFREYSWKIAKTRKGRNSDAETNFAELNVYAESLRSRLSRDDNASLPLVAFYPVERVVLDVPLKIKGRHSFDQVDGYENSLNQGVDFRRFFEWFREREDTENESGLTDEVLVELYRRLGDQKLLWDQLKQLQASTRDRQLTAVRTAVSQFMPEFANLRVRRRPRLHMSIEKSGHELNVSQLSQGEKSLLALIGDIARRLAMMNPIMDNPLHGDGIVLIDEIDMHMHPDWQSNIVERLSRTFPNIQFVLTTHSPLVIGSSPNTLVYDVHAEGVTRVASQYGKDANSVLTDVMDTLPRNEEIHHEISQAIRAIQQKRLTDAREKLDNLKEKLGDSNPEITKLTVLLKRMEMSVETNQ